MIVFLMTKYEGTFETDLRIRLKNGDNILTSPPFRGFINPDQFYLSSEDEYFKNKLQDNPLGIIQYYFYGAVPVEYKSI